MSNTTASSTPAPLPLANPVHTATHVLMAEAEALQALAKSLGAPFVAAVSKLSLAQGRVVVTGMGKSGHVARKIAATLASTGTPAMYVHPGEASHGDLGMITHNDAVLALSNSGDTVELSDIIVYTRRFAIPLIAMTSGANSVLAEQADIKLILPPVPEVCPMGLAPTTSTTMMLALGDALAVAVLELKGFTADDFRNFHPGGRLGDRLKRLSQVMLKESDMPLIRHTQSMSDALVEMTAKRLGCVGVVDDAGQLMGIITDGDIRRKMEPDLLQKNVSHVMTANPMTLSPRILAEEALQKLNASNRTQAFVVDDAGKPVGIIHIHELLRLGLG